MGRGANLLKPQDLFVNKSDLEVKVKKRKGKVKKQIGLLKKRESQNQYEPVSTSVHVVPIEWKNAWLTLS